MTIAVIAAMQKELDLLLPLIHDAKTETRNCFTFHVGTMPSGKGREPNEIIAMQCGIGKVNAAIGTLTLIEQYDPDLVINTGVAGGTGHGAKILDVVLASGVGYHDFYCYDEPWGKVPNFPKIFPTFPLPVSADTKRGVIASGDLFVSKPEEVAHVLEIYPDAKAVDMESAAIAQVCHLKGIPFSCLRVVSDTPGQGENIAQYENFWADAPRKSFAVIEEALQKL